MIDVVQQINKVRRRVGTHTLEAGAGRTVTISQTYDAEIDDLWDACTNPERLPRWFAPVSGDLRLGGHYQVEGNAGGTIQRCDPPKSFAATWEFGGEMSWIEVTLSTDPGGGTRFELAHTVPENAHWVEFGPGATGVGWDLALLGLATHLAGETVDPEDAWSASDEAKRFVTLSSQRWYEAFVESGAEPAVAQERADRVTAFYTGES